MQGFAIALQGWNYFVISETTWVLAVRCSLRDCELRVGMHAEHTLSDTALIAVVCRLGM